MTRLQAALGLLVQYLAWALVLRIATGSFYSTLVLTEIVGLVAAAMAALICAVYLTLPK